MNSAPDQTKSEPVAPSQTPTVTPTVSLNAFNTTPVGKEASSNTVLGDKPDPLTSETVSTVPVLTDFNSTIAPPIKPPVSPPPFVLHGNTPPAKSHKFPLVVLGLFLIVAVTGFGGSFVYFGILHKENKIITANNLPVVSPALPSENSPTPLPPTNIFVTPSISFRNLFSADVYASDNPFDDSANPFTGVTTSNNPDTDAYQNPFEGQQ